jgi:hypothetical protein
VRPWAAATALSLNVPLVAHDRDHEGYRASACSRFMRIGTFANRVPYCRSGSLGGSESIRAAIAFATAASDEGYRATVRESWQ